jgi:hypothetical protein
MVGPAGSASLSHQISLSMVILCRPGMPFLPSLSEPSPSRGGRSSVQAVMPIQLPFAAACYVDGYNRSNPVAVYYSDNGGSGMANGSDTEYLAYVHGRTTGLRRTAYLLCGDEHQADDLVQETITKLYARWSRISRLENVDGYVHTMLVRTFLDEKRRGWWKVSSAPHPNASIPSGAHDDQTR